MGSVTKKGRLLSIQIINKRKISEPPLMEYDDYINYSEMISYLGYFNLIKKLDLVLTPTNELSLYIGNCEFLNVNYLINYLLNQTSMSIKLNESIFAGGKGFSMYKAICSSLGEAFERLVGCLEFFLRKDQLIKGSYIELVTKGYSCVNPKQLQLFSREQLEEDNFLFDPFDEDTVASWVEVNDYISGEKLLFPAVILLMFYRPQLKDEDRIGYATSGGLTSHYRKELGIEHGIQEILERNEINLCWYTNRQPKEIVLNDIRHPLLKEYKDHIDENGIKFYLHNVDQENFHVVTAKSFDEDLTKYAFNTGGGISNDIEKAVLASLEEYSQSVSNTRKIVYAPEWITSKFSNYVLNVNEGDDPKKFKTFYQSVSYYGLKANRNKLDWYVKNNSKINLSEIRDKQEKLSVEQFIEKEKIRPIIMEHEMSKQFKHIFISKTYLLEYTPAFISGTPAFGHEKYQKYLGNGTLNPSILPYP